MKDIRKLGLLIAVFSMWYLSYANSKASGLNHTDNQPISISGELERVEISTKEQKILYEYADKQILWEVEKGVVLINIMQTKKTVLQLKADQKILMVKTKTKGWQPFSLVSKDIDPDLLASLLNNPTFYGKAFIGNALKNKQATELEMKIIDLLTPYSDQTSQPVGTTSGSCSCGSGSITVTCPNGCGISCKDEDREVCEVIFTSGERAQCSKQKFCIGACRC
ncbi:hypothetical protein SAMN04488104_104513 [Algoriphagus faecimaris]|uniref:Uncharacterized protein n=1 Tax=Algoriphagus faecimaris TaxID=686796 RepID=A0A1G6WJP1_9BACT|nr:hypothetical protein [Algoriphagus faecimaris]SDD66180.1 hypothetical protein SAMN04488104_104513 [Algoriphagus faecimaris]